MHTSCQISLLGSLIVREGRVSEILSGSSELLAVFEHADHRSTMFGDTHQHAISLAFDVANGRLLVDHVIRELRNYSIPGKETGIGEALVEWLIAICAHIHLLSASLADHV